MKLASIRRIRQIAILILLGGAGLYIAYAGRRTPIEPEQGSHIQWLAGSQPTALNQCRVATYNIHRGKGTDGIRDLARTAGVLEGIDLVALNEVGGPAFIGQPDQAEQLGRLLGIGWLFAPNQRRWHMDHFGNGLLCRLAVGLWLHEPLEYHPEKSRSHRNLLKAEIELAEQPVTVLVTHLDRGAIRPTQLQFVLQAFAAHEPAILLGDLNTTEADPILSTFLSDTNNVDAVAVALGEEDPPHRIDWILTRGLEVLNGGIVPAGVSDHPCYWVDVMISP